MINDNLGQNWDSFTPAERKAHIAASGKPVGIVMDHVGNIKHGLPDTPRPWTLDRKEKRTNGATIMLKTCTNPECVAVYERYRTSCPYCGTKPVPAMRSGPEFVDGDLFELDLDTLAKMRGDIARVDMHPEAYREELAGKNAPLIGQLAGVKRHAERQDAQTVLRGSIAYWAGYQRAIGRADSESYRLFYLLFSVDVLTAQALGTKDALALNDKINQSYDR
jgi:hypothetical protein